MRLFGGFLVFIELILDYVMHLFDFIKNGVVRAIVQILAMLVCTVLICAIIFGISKLILRII